MPYTQTNYAASPLPQEHREAYQQQLQVLAQGFNAAIAELNQTYRVIDAIMPFVQVNGLLNQEIDQLEQMVYSLVPFVQVADIWQSEALQNEQVLDNLCWVMSDPEYLIYWSFLNWGQAIQPNGQPALEWIADEWIKLLEIYEHKYMQANGGQHSSMWSRMQPQNVNPIMGSPDTQSFYAPRQVQVPPLPPIPGSGGQQGGGSPVDQLKQRISLMKSGNPDLAQQMQRQHLQQRQQFNMEVW